MSEREHISVDVVVVGAGVAGLACAVRLARAGFSVRVVEAESGPGGRARTDWHEGRPVDRGFQAAFSAYPAFRAFVREIGIPGEDLRPFAGGAAFFDGAHWSQLSSSTSITRFGALSPADRARLVRLAAELRFVPPRTLLARDGAAPTTEAFLLDRGFSPQAIEAVFRPLFGVMFLDRTLAADPGYFQFLCSMLVRGPAVLPADGLGMVADWAAGAVRQAGGNLEFGSRVAALVREADGPATGVRLEDLRQIHAGAVVLAVDPPSARKLLSPVDPETARRIPIEGASATSARFALDHSLYRGRVILLNAEPDAGTSPRIDLLCQTTNVNRHGAVGGPHVVIATSVGDSDATADGIEDAVERQVHRWYPGFPWGKVAHSLGVVRHPFAQFRPLAGVRRGLPGPRTQVPNVILAGEFTMHPSLEGAVSSGVTAAEILGRQLGVKTVGARQVWAVQEITAALARRLAGIPSVWVEAEIQNLRQRGGQVYFTLRDSHQIDASMRAALFERLAHRPADGSLVYAYGRVEFWAERAQLSLRIERMEPAGEGAMLAQIEAIKATLAAEGLLADARKRALPLVPRRIGLITSAAGAARQDVLNNIWARFPADVVLADVPVQGATAPRAIVRALDALNAIPEVEVIIIARGGGPLEDLMAFNDEQLCRAVAASRVPVVSAVGHEKDVTVCDLVADRRVSTPTGAAEAVVPDRAALEARLADAARGLVRGLERTREASAVAIAQRTLGLIAGLRSAEHRSASQVAAAGSRLAPAVQRIADASAHAVPVVHDRLVRGAGARHQAAAQRVAANAGLLEVLSPSRTVARGYAIARDPASGRPVVSAAALRVGAELELEMRDGRAQVTVKETHT